MTTPATEAKRRAFAAPYAQDGRVDGPPDHQTYEPSFRPPQRRFSRLFFVALIIAVASTVGFVGLFLSVLFTI